MIHHIYEVEGGEQYPQLHLTKKAYEGIKALIHSRLNVKWIGLSKYKRDEMYGHVEDAIIKELDKKIRTDVGGPIYGKDINTMGETEEGWKQLRAWVYQISDMHSNDYYNRRIKAGGARGAYNKDPFEKEILGKIKSDEDREFVESMFIWDDAKKQYISLPGGIGASNKERLEDILKQIGFGGQDIDASRRPSTELTPEIEPGTHKNDIENISIKRDYESNLERAFKKLDRKDGTDEDGLTDGEIELYKILAGVSDEYIGWDDALNILNGNPALGFEARTDLREIIFGSNVVADKNKIKSMWDKIKKIIIYPDNYEYLRSKDIIQS